MTDTKVSPTAKSKKRPPKIVSPYESKRMTVERGVVDELLLVCGVIGTTTEGEKLVPVTDCLNWLQDLQRALRRDDDTFRPISLLLQKWKVVPQKLLPLIMTCRYDTPMVLTIVKILVILTKPLGESTKKAGRFAIDTKKYSPESVKEQIKLRENALAQSDMLMEFKRAMVHHTSHKSEGGNGLLSVFVSLLAEPISKTGSARSDVDHLTIELVLHLFRNLLAAEPLIKSSSDVSQSSARLHQELVCLFESELVFEILLVVAQDMESRENQNYNLLLMELLNLLTKSQDPTAVARSMKVKSSAAMMTTTSKENSNKKNSSAGGSLLRDSLKKEKQKLHTGVTTSRHSHFGGTLVVKRPDGKRQYVSAALMQSSQGPPTAPKRKNRKREAFVGSTYGRAGASNASYDPTALKAQQTIHKFCEKFVADCYGPLMKSIKNEFRRDSVRLEEGDTVVYFRIVWFFCQWWRVCRKEGGLGHLIFTMDVFSHKLVLTAMDSYIQHKKYTQLTQTVALYSEMLHLLHTMYGSKDSTENIMALGLMDTLFYGSEPLDRLPKLLSKWAPGTSTRDHLCDVVEVVHMTLKLLETNANACLKDEVIDPKAKKDKKAQQKRDAVARMKANVVDFDHNAYVLRKIISNQVVCMYTHLLSQYSVNAPHVNHRIMAFLIRFQKIKIAVSEDGDEPEHLLNQLATKTVTLEPMLYSINMILVLEQILNDQYIRKEKDFAHLLSFACRIITNFAAQAKDNPLLYVESLFRHPVPHRFCEYTTNNYVNEELRMIAERELLLEEQRRMIEEEDANSDDEGNEDLALRDDGAASSSLSVKAPQSLASKKKVIDDDDSDEEIEWDDADKVTEGNLNPSKKIDVILSDSESDDDEEDISSKRKRDEAGEEAASKKSKAHESATMEESSDEDTSVTGPDKKNKDSIAVSNKATAKKRKAVFDDSSDDEELPDCAIEPKDATKKTTVDDKLDRSSELELPSKGISTTSNGTNKPSMGVSLIEKEPANEVSTGSSEKLVCAGQNGINVEKQ